MPGSRRCPFGLFRHIAYPPRGRWLRTTRRLLRRRRPAQNLSLQYGQFSSRGAFDTTQHSLPGDQFRFSNGLDIPRIAFLAHLSQWYSSCSPEERLTAIGAVSRSFLFSLRGGGRDGYGGSRHSGSGEITATRVPLCDGMRPSVAS